MGGFTVARFFGFLRHFAISALKDYFGGSDPVCIAHGCTAPRYIFEGREGNPAQGLGLGG